MKILIAPDKFKGSLTAQEACLAIERGIKKYDATIKTILHPLADGGEGTLDILSNLLDLETIEVEVSNPLFNSIFSFYKKNNNTAFVEMSLASGLELLKQDERNCINTTTFGTGELILDAIQKGVKKIYLFVGGSATNDVGIGMAAALGYRFFDENNNPISPIGKNLIHIHSIDSSQLKFNPSAIDVTVVCDVENVLFGKKGAAYVYAAQKGANEKEIELLDQGLRHFSKKTKEHFQKDISQIKGAGATGGLGAGAMVFLNAKVQSGIQIILQLTHFEEKLKDVDLVITGEGKLDHQTLEGKVIKGVVDLAKEKSIPVNVICGACEISSKEIKRLGIQKVVSILDGDVTLGQAISETKERVEQLAFLMIKELISQ